MSGTPHAATANVSLCTRTLGRAAQAWAIGGALLFAPGALALAFFGFLGLGVFGFAVLVPIGLTLWGAGLFYAAGAALRRGEPAGGALAGAVLATWNVLVLFSVSVLWNVGDMAITDWSRFIAEYSRVNRLDLYLVAASLLHVAVNGAFLIAAAFARMPSGDETPAAA
jgi:hypothetical protein